MERYGPSTYGDRIAAEYDELYGDLFDVDATVSVLAELAGAAPALELGVGTGRVALPLAARGVEVCGIDASEAMVEVLRAKPGGRDLDVAIGDFADFDLGRRFGLVYVVFNTFFGLTSQDDQVRCFECVARHLDDGGRFVLELFVPDVARFDRHQRVGVDRVALDEVELEVSRHDPVHQRISSQRVVIGGRGARLYPVFARYAYPSELDLMARVAGLSLEDRWSDWRRAPFTSDSNHHVSVYARRPGVVSPRAAP